MKYFDDIVEMQERLATRLAALDTTSRQLRCTLRQHEARKKLRDTQPTSKETILLRAEIAFLKVVHRYPGVVFRYLPDDNDFDSMYTNGLISAAVQA